ncbi:DUF6940 family protein, partial [Almyronema epifaneia]
MTFPNHSEQGQFAIFSEALAGDRQRLWLTQAATQEVLRWCDVLSGWQQTPALRQLFSQFLADRPYAAFFWETPPLSEVTLLHPFECCVIDSPQLATANAEPQAFADYIHPETCDQVEAFPNLKGDTLLVVPCQNSQQQHYVHLAAF